MGCTCDEEGLKLGGVGGICCDANTSELNRDETTGDCASELASDESWRRRQSSCCMWSGFSSKRSPLVWSRAPSRVSRSWVRGWPLGSQRSGSPGQPWPSHARRYISWRPLTSHDCCCSSISTYLSQVLESNQIFLTAGLQEKRLTPWDTLCHGPFSVRQRRRWHCLPYNGHTDWSHHTNWLARSSIYMSTS